MRKLSKKMISIFLSVVLVMGIFSLILPTANFAPNVKAEAVATTYDYMELLDGVGGDTGILDTRVWTVKDTNGNDKFEGLKYLGIWNAMGLDVDWGALGISRHFFNGIAAGAEREDIHPYIVYNVTPGTSFELFSAVHRDRNADDLVLNFYVSNDGVTWIPISAERKSEGVWKSKVETWNSYNSYVYTIANVGQKTNFVKAEYPLSIASRRDDGSEPSSDLVVYGVTFTPVESYAVNGQTLFEAKSFGAQKELYEQYFIAYPDFVNNGSENAATSNYGMLANSTWGDFELKDRSYIAMVAPGSHFYLETTNNSYMKDVGEALVAKGELDSADQARIRVYSSASLSDEATWTEWDPMPYSCQDNHTPTFNFYLPKDHIYVRIVYPQQGKVGSILGNDANGNDAAFFTDMVFTPYVKADADYTRDYTGDQNLYHDVVDVKNLNDDNDNGVTIPYRGEVNLQNGNAKNTGDPYNIGDRSITYAVEGGKMFNLEYGVRLGSYFIKDWPGTTKGAYEAEVTDNSSMEMIIQTSTDNSTWTNAYETESGYAETTSSFNSQCYVFDVSYLVPKDAKYVRVSFGITGVGYLNYNDEYRGFHDCLYIRKVSVANANNVYTAPAQDSSSGPVEYIYTTDATVSNGTYDGNLIDKDSFDTGNGNTTSIRPGYGHLVAGEGGDNTRTWAGTRTRPYVIYDVIPGTPFSFDYTMRATAKAASETTAALNIKGGLGNAGLAEFEFFVYGRADENSSWTYIGKTDSGALNYNGGDTSSYDTFGLGNGNFTIPAGVNQVKVEFPNTGSFTTATPVTYDYSTAKDNYGMWNNGEIGADYITFNDDKTDDSKDNIIGKDGNGIRPTFGSLSSAWGTKEFYIIYKVKAGTTFVANFEMHDSATREGYAAKTGEPFEAKLQYSADKSSWSEAITTAGQGTNAALACVVPVGYEYVKITFPQKGIITTDCRGNDAATLTGVSFYTNAWITAGNDAAYLYNVKYATGIKVDPSAYIYTTDATVSNGTYDGNLIDKDSFDTGNGNTTSIRPGYGHLVAGEGGDNTRTWAGTRTRPYVIYDVIPGTPFSFNYTMRATAKAASETTAALNIKGGLGNAGLAEFEFFVYGRADENSSWTYIGKTDSSALNYNGGDTSSYDTFGLGNGNFTIPAGVNQVKVEFPNTGSFTTATPVTYDYSTASGNYGMWNNGDIGADYITFNDDKTDDSKDNIIGKDGNGIRPTFGSLSSAWRTKEFYIIYKVKAGTTFVANFEMHDANTRNGYAAKTGEPFEAKLQYSADKSSWSEAITTAGQGTNAALACVVPVGYEYVKITFPQKGIITGTDYRGNDAATLTGVSFYTNAWITAGNDAAYLYNVKYATAEKPGPDVDYTALNSANITNASKAELNVYHQANTQLEKTAGIKAKADGAFVIYKIKENTMLTVNSGDALSFEYSTDDTNYKPFEAVKTCRGYEIPAIKDRNYIKVKLDNGEAITNAYAEVLAPTVKFYIPYLDKYELKDVAGYGAAANSVSPTINTLRPGYKFEGWTEYDDEGIYIDKTVEAVYIPDPNVTYTVSYTVGDNTTTNNYKFDNRVTISADATNDKGEVFSKWVDAKGATVSNSRNFSFLVSGNIALKAVYAKTKEDIAPYIYVTDEPIITTNDNGTWNLSVVWRTAMSGDVTVKETGILLGKDVDKAHLILWDGKTQENTFKMKHNNTATNKTAVYTVKNIKAGETRTALPYAILSNGDVIYGENVIKVTDGVKVTSTDFEFNGTITPTVLNNYLDRAVSYDVFGTADGQTSDSAIYNARDFVRQTGAKYLARGLGFWIPNGTDIYGDNFTKYKNWVAEIHEVDPEVIIEACIFETCSEATNEISIPAWVFEEFGETPENRTFNYEDMKHTIGKSYTNGSGTYGEGVFNNGTVHIPSVSQLETQMFIYYRACTFIDMGVEALHLGQMYRVGAKTVSGGNVTSVDNAAWTEVIDKIRDYASEHARRGYVLINGHNESQKLLDSKDKEGKTMLVDFNAYPIRIKPASGASNTKPADDFQAVKLDTSSKAPYNVVVKDMKTPSGYTVADCYPYLLEFDNFGVNTANLNKVYSSGDYVWGYDEISWYVNQQAQYRHNFLTTTVVEWVNNTLPNTMGAANGHVALPGKRTAFISATGASEYLTNEANIYNGKIYSTYYEDGAGKYGTYGAQIPLWDAKIAGDVEAIKAAFDLLN